MAWKTAAGRFAGFGVLAASALAAATVWPAVVMAQEREEDSLRYVLYRAVASDVRPILGVYVATSGETGLRVTSVMEGWPAVEAGIREGDVIVSIDGHELAEPLEEEAERGLPAGGSLRERRLRALLKAAPEGEAVEVTLRRNGETMGFTVVPRMFTADVQPSVDWRYYPSWGSLDSVGLQWQLEALAEEIREHSERFRDQYERIRERPETRYRFHGTPLASRSLEVHWDGTRRSGRHGLDLLELNPELGSYFGTDEGVLVADVEDDSTLGLRPGDVIVGLDGREVVDIARLYRILDSYEDDEEIGFRIWRDGAETTVTGTIS